jgi:hypothetical protein
MSAKPQRRTPLQVVWEQIVALPDWRGDVNITRPDFKASLHRILNAHGWTRKAFLNELGHPDLCAGVRQTPPLKGTTMHTEQLVSHMGTGERKIRKRIKRETTRTARRHGKRLLEDAPKRVTRGWVD